MEENKNEIDELIKSIDSSFKEMSLKDIVSAHENYFGENSLSFDDDKSEKEADDTNLLETDENKKAVEEVEQPEKKKKDNKKDKEKRKAAKDELERESHNDSHQNELSEKVSPDETEDDAAKKAEMKDSRGVKVQKAGRIGSWFQTFCYMRIPVIGFIYILVMAFSRKTPEYKKEFAKGYLLYKVLVWILAIVLLYCLYKIGLGFVDGMLSFIKA